MKLMYVVYVIVLFHAINKKYDVAPHIQHHILAPEADDALTLANKAAYDVYIMALGGLKAACGLCYSGSGEASLLP